MTIQNYDDIDSMIRVFNNVAIAKNSILSGKEAEAIRYLNNALSWSERLLDKEHPMTDIKNPSLSPPMLKLDIITTE